MLPEKKIVCPDCEGSDLDRRGFLRGVAAAATAGALGSFALPRAGAAPTAQSAAETLVKKLYDTLDEKQRKAVCFAWDHVDTKRGLLRTHVSNNWHITQPTVTSEFYTKDQQALIHDVFKSIFNPEWHAR